MVDSQFLHAILQRLEVTDLPACTRASLALIRALACTSRSGASHSSNGAR